MHTFLNMPPHINVEARSFRKAVEPKVIICRNAFVPTCTPAAFTSFNGEREDGFYAGVYDKHNNVIEYSMLSRRYTHVTIPCPADKIDSGSTHHFQGDAVYAGLLSPHFGHFMLESTMRLWWPLKEKFNGFYVFQGVFGDTTIPDFAARFFNLLGISDKVIVVTKPVSFDRMYVPQPTFVMQESFIDEFEVPFLLAGEAADKSAYASDPDVMGRSKGLYLSRIQFAKRRALGEERIQQEFVGSGFKTAAMEVLPLEKQILLARRSEAIAGINGSAFFAGLFTSGGLKTIHILRDFWFPTEYLALNEMKENRSYYIYGRDLNSAPTPGAYDDDTPLDIETIRQILRSNSIVTA